VVGLVPGVPASAATAAEGTHCVVSAETGAERCYGSLESALTAASGDRVELSEGARPGGAEIEQEVAAANREVGAAGEVIGAVVYDDARYQGSSYTITIGAPCKKDGWMEWELDLPEDWRNRVTSTQSWANCWVWLWDEAGTKEGPYEEDNPDVGAFSDRAWRVGMS